MTKSPQSGRLQRFVLRPLFIFVSFVLVLFAVLQTAGRFTMATLHLYEDEVAALASRADVRVQGIRGHWSGFNPGIEIDELVFAGGYAKSAVVELDVLESIFHSAWVARRVEVEELFLDVVQEQGVWRLRGMAPAQEPFNPTDLLTYSDELQAAVHLTLTSQAGEVSALQGEIRVASHHGQQFLHAAVHSDEQRLDIQGWRQFGEAWWGQRGWPADDDQIRLSLQGELSIPRALVPADILLTVTEGKWSQIDGQGQGGVSLRASIDLAALQHPLALELDARGISRDGVVSAEFGKIRLQGGDAVSATDAVGPTKEPETNNFIELSGVRLRSLLSDSAAEISDPVLRLWHESLDLGAISAFVSQQFPVEHPVSRWTRSTAIVGRALNVHAFFDPEQGLGYAATVADLSMQGYRGAPGVTAAQGRIWGHSRGVALQVNTGAATLNFPDLFHDTWSPTYMQGVVKAWFRGGYLGLRGKHLKTQIGESSVVGDFSLTRPTEQFEQRVALQLTVDQADMDSARSFIPYKIPDNLVEWLAYGPIAGNLSGAKFAYQGQVHKDDDSGLHRRIELTSAIQGGAVRYHQEWPVVEDLQGTFHVAGQQIRVDLLGATSDGVVMSAGQAVLHNNAAFVTADLKAQGEGQTLLDFVLASPLRENLSFVTQAWRSQGQMQMDAQLVIPIKAEEAPELAVDLGFVLVDFDLNMPEYRTHFATLNGTGKFSLPHNLTGLFDGQLFGAPAQVRATHDDDWLRFAIAGEVTPEHIYRVVGLDELGIMRGEFAFDSELAVAMRTNKITNLELTSDLVGLDVKLPAPLAKSAQEIDPLELGVQFLNDYQSIRWSYKETQGWVHFADAIERGAIGVNAPPPTPKQNQQAILIKGSLDNVVLSDWVSGEGDAAVALPQDWVIQSLKIGQMHVDELVFQDLRLSGTQTGADVAFKLRSEDLAGVITIPQSSKMSIDLEHLRLPEPAGARSISDQLLGDVGFQETLAMAETHVVSSDPLTVEVGKSLPAAMVTVDELLLGDEPFGRWSFEIAPAEHTLQLRNFSVDVHGVHIADAQMQWDLATDQSYFQGQVDLDDLKETLPKWDYAAALETNEASLTADARWAGSPANIGLLGLHGELRFRAREGRFLEVESGGGLRVLSLLNFSNIAKRISLDFSDVTVDGMPFDKIDAFVRLNEGNLRFLERMEVESKSSSFQIAGNVDLHTGILDNEMIVTLPVSDSLPWYAVYLALANPLAGLGVLVGERVLRKPLRAFSTAKFSVKGTLDEPDVNFVGLWDQSMRDLDEKQGQEQPSPAAEVPSADEQVQKIQLGGSN